MGNTPTTTIKTVTKTETVYVKPNNEEFKDAELDALKQEIMDAMVAKEFFEMQHKISCQYKFDDTFALTMMDDANSLQECIDLIGAYFKDLDPKLVTKFQGIFEACYKSKNMKNLDAVRNESLTYQTKSGNNAGMRMNYKIGVSKNKDWMKPNEFVMVIGLKFEVWGLDPSLVLMSKADLYE